MTLATPTPASATPTIDGAAGVEALFARQRAAFRHNPYPQASERRAHLEALAAALRRRADALVAAVDADFGGRSAHETRLLELFPSLEAIRHARRRLARWMRPERAGASIWFRPGSARVIRQPLGVVGIVVPWNYPIYLAVGPLVSSLAAGNRALIKMSEYSPATAVALAAALREAFDEEHVALVDGGVELAESFVALPFDHLLFTGSGAVGRKVMAAAAANLTPVTLELGGKSPAIVAEGYPIDVAARRIVFGKCLNAGQTCIAPDYALVPHGQLEAFVAAARAEVERLYPRIDATPDYTSIASERHLARLAGYLDDARSRGATLHALHGGAGEPGRAMPGRRLAPVALTRVAASMQVMQHEIFGPLLPIVPYATLDEAIRFVNDRPRPLALYYFDRARARIERVLHETHAGGVTVNDVLLHIAQDSLPFGGIGESGMGQYHGRWGFEALSKAKGVFHQTRINGVALLKPPFGWRVNAMLRRMLG